MVPPCLRLWSRILPLNDPKWIVWDPEGGCLSEIERINKNQIIFQVFVVVVETMQVLMKVVPIMTIRSYLSSQNVSRTTFATVTSRTIDFDLIWFFYFISQSPQVHFHSNSNKNVWKLGTGCISKTCTRLSLILARFLCQYTQTHIWQTFWHSLLLVNSKAKKIVKQNL